MAIRVTGMYSGLDTESIITELVSAQSYKKNSLVKAQTKLSWKQDAWKALNTKIYDFYTNTLSDLRFQASYMTKTTKVSNTNAIQVVTGADAVDGVRTVNVKQLAKGSYLTGGDLSKNDSGIYFTGGASLSQLRQYNKLDNSTNITGSFSVVGANGASFSFEVNENTTINDVVSMIQSTGLNANYDQDSQRIFISSANTGALNNFNLVANDEGGMNALACLGLLSKEDLVSEENVKWAAYKDAAGNYTSDFDDALAAEIERRLKNMQDTSDELAKQNTNLVDENGKLTADINDLLDSLNGNDLTALASLGITLSSGKSIAQALADLYGTKDGSGNYTGGIYDTIADKKAAYTGAQATLADTQKALTDSQTALADKQSALQDAQDAYDALQASGTATQPDLDAAQAAVDAAQADVNDATTAVNDAQTAYNNAENAYNAAKADYDTAQGAYDEIRNFLDDVVYGEFVNKEIQGAAGTDFAGTYYQLQDENGKALNVYEKLDASNNGTGEFYAQDGTLLYKKDASGNYLDENNVALTQDANGNYLDSKGNIIAATSGYVQERSGGLKEDYEAAEKAGTVTPAMQAQVDAINKLNNILVTVGQNKDTIAVNNKKIDANNTAITDIADYIAETGGNPSELAKDAREEFEAKVDAAQKALEMAADTTGAYAGMLTGTKVDAQDAIIEINGAEFTSMTNTFNVNGLTLTALEVTDKEVTITTSIDTDGIYDMIKNFFTEYNKLINEMDSLYNAESSSGYEPLLSEEKDALADSEVEEWEKKIKDSLLRRDNTLSSISFAMLNEMMQGITVNGKTMYLSDFGISTLGYFNAKENERNAYHIDGNPDDPDVKANEDKLKSMIANDPETVMEFFTQLSQNLYEKLTDKMAATDYSSAFTVYNDKQMKTDYDDYTKKIKAQEDKLNALMDKWYAKFSKMETALSKLESKSSSLTSLLGG